MKNLMIKPLQERHGKHLSCVGGDAYLRSPVPCSFPVTIEPQLAVPINL